VAVVGAGGIGFDVAEALVLQRAPARTLTPEPSGGANGAWAIRRGSGGLASKGPPRNPRPRSAWLLQRKAEKPGRRLGKTTGWIHRANLAMKSVRMLGGVTYEKITVRPASF
jgi:2,4-dienoyl-CoA reductase (NADPH2)